MLFECLGAFNSSSCCLATAAHAHGVEVIGVVPSTPRHVLVVRSTAVSVRVFCAVVAVFAPVAAFFIGVAFAVRACILAIFADFAQAFGVGHCDYLAVFRVGEVLAVARVQFEAWFACTADGSGGGFDSAARGAVRRRSDTVPVGGGFLGGRAGVFQTHVLCLGHSVTRVALQTHFAGLRAAVGDARSWAAEAHGVKFVLGYDVEPGGALDLLAVSQGPT